MQYEIQALLALLDIHTLKRLPCFWDRPDLIEFRIGLEAGPQIKFYPENDDTYYLTVKDSDSNSFIYPIINPSAFFTTANEIHGNIRALTNDADYKKLFEDEDRVGMMLTTVNNIVKPILKRVLKEKYLE